MNSFLAYLLGIGKGNDQVRSKLAFKALNPSLQVIAPWRLSEFYDKFRGRQDLLKFAAKNNIRVLSSPKAPWSMDENLVLPIAPLFVMSRGVGDLSRLLRHVF